MAHSPLHVIILTAGKGTRMKSDLPKVLHSIAGKPMIRHVVDAVIALEPASVTVVVSPNQDAVKAEVTDAISSAQFAVQAEQKGTGHAVLCGMEKLGSASAQVAKSGSATINSAQVAKGGGATINGDVLVVYGDTPLMTSDTLKTLLDEKEKAAATIALAGIHLDDPTGYGRLIMPDGKHVERIVEEKDASDAQRKIHWGWGGIMTFSADFLDAGLKMMTPSEATGEYYLTELLEIATASQNSAQVAEGDSANNNLMVEMDVVEAVGVNDRTQLAEAETVLQERLRKHAMRNGATLIAPETIFLSADTALGRDVIVHPHVVFGAGVHVADGVEIKSFSHIERATIGANCVIGPYARLRPGTELAEDVRIGNFVELKKSYLGKGSKVNHLSYVGDAELGENVNIGAGTITCNYDGANKYNTTIKSGAFIGSNTALVAPVEIGENALIGAGSVITKDVPNDALAFERNAQVVKPNHSKKK